MCGHADEDDASAAPGEDDLDLGAMEGLLKQLMSQAAPQAGPPGAATDPSEAALLHQLLQSMGQGVFNGTEDAEDLSSAAGPSMRGAASDGRFTQHAQQGSQGEGADAAAGVSSEAVRKLMQQTKKVVEQQSRFSRGEGTPAAAAAAQRRGRPGRGGPAGLGGMVLGDGGGDPFAGLFGGLGGLGGAAGTLWMCLCAVLHLCTTCMAQRGSQGF